MRCFFALEPDMKTKLAVDNWRQCNFPSIYPAIPAANFHLTLLFLGELSPEQLEPLIENTDRITLPCFSVQLNTMGYFPKPTIGWLGCESTPPPLTELVRQLKKASFGIGKTGNPSFVPHLSLFRGDDTPPPATLLPPDFEITFSEFGLYRSLPIKDGVTYQQMASWSLAPAFSFKKSGEL